MPPSLRTPSRTLQPTPLHQSTFSPFGAVIFCPFPASLSTFPSSPPSNPSIIPANQSTALKHLDVSPMHNLYASAPSSHPSKPAMNMFSCFPRRLRPNARSGGKLLFDVEVLERHPYTTQTFIPLSSSSSGGREGRYLVIVAPTLAPQVEGPFQRMGPPDLDNLRAFWAHAGQAVTYGAGTWHAPMAVVGEERMDFVVVQFVNGVAEEDCQEVLLEKEGGICVKIQDWGGEGKARL